MTLRLVDNQLSINRGDHMLQLINFLMMFHLLLGRLVVIILPMFWAYNVAQRGDTFGYAFLTYFGNVFLLGLIWSAIWWVLNTMLKGLLFGPED